MIMWLILFILLIVMAAGGTAYLLTRFHRFSFIEKLGKIFKLISWIIALLPLVLIVLASLRINTWTAIIVLIHLFVIWAVCDIVAYFIRKMNGWERYRNYEGAVALLLTAGYLIYGWHQAHTVYQTSYTMHTAKDIGSGQLRIVEIADSHLGITLDGEKFAAEMERVNAAHPDIVVVAGDFVDDDSCRSDMIRACQALGDIQTKYGVYFIFGNHDKGYSKTKRDFNTGDLRAELKRNNVIILEDENVLVNDEFYVIGRKDKSDEERLSMSDLTAGLDKSKYMIVLDHQPNDYEAEAIEGSDLVLSGHTHGGHLFPAGQIGKLMGANDRVYGTERRGTTDFIVTSGISGWAIPFKTGTFSEFVIIDVKKQ